MKQKKNNNFIKRIKAFLYFFAIFLLVLFFMSLLWMFRTWNNLTMDELIFHLTTPLEGTNEGMVIEYILCALLPALLLVILLIVFFYRFRNKNYYTKLKTICMTIVICLAVCTGVYTWNNLKIGQYLKSQNTESTFIEDYYVNPSEAELSFPDKKRNLIYIFLESMEITYADTINGGAFEENVIPELTSLAKDNEDFSGKTETLNGAYVSTGATWTIGAMFAHTSGLPLKVSIDGNDMDTQSSFFPGIETLGDILEEEGYSQTLLIGSDATFGGRRLYFTDHGNYEINDYVYAKENKLIPKKYKVWWGYEDKKLFEFAKEKLIDLSSKDQPFNLTMLTVDTHFEDGYVCEDCSNAYDNNQYANVMACSSKKVNEFISWVQEQDFYDNTTIVLVGDHLTMDKDFCEDIDGSYERKIYTAFINPSCKNESNDMRKYNTLDLFPTTLSAMGVDIKGDQLGLGTNLFSKTPTLTERFGVVKLNFELSNNSSFLDSLGEINEDLDELNQRNEKRRKNVKIKVMKKVDSDGMYAISLNDFSNFEEEISKVSC